MNTIVRRGAGRWVLLVTLPHRSREAQTLAARLAARGPLLILDGGNRANVHGIAAQAGWQAEVLERIRIARAFTCYQMAALLESVHGQVQPGIILILDFPATFYDENVPLFDRQRLLKACLQCIDRLGRETRLVVTATPPPAGADDSLGLYESMLANAPEVHMYEMPARAERQERLF